MTVTAWLWLPAGAAAYNPAAAASWADAHATNYSCGTSGYPQCDSNDCQNFVSLALNYGGGYGQVLGNGDETDAHNWYLTKNGLGGWTSSLSWDYVSWNQQFQFFHWPGGTVWGYKRGDTTYVYSGLNTGDVLYYDWDSNGTFTHSAIQTTPGYDSEYVNGTQWGDLVDAHTSNRRRRHWTLQRYNAHAATTNIELMHIASGN
jgi:hypothetical protein